MPSLIQQLQAEALDPNTRISDLLRKALVAATKLEITEMRSWLDGEMRGYNCHADQVPDYRHIKGHLRGFNPYRGWLPAQITDDDLESLIEKHVVFESISQVEYLAQAEEDVWIEFNSTLQESLRELFNVDWNFRLLLNKVSLVHILDASEIK